jgi:hypothetical protein
MSMFSGPVHVLELSERGIKCTTLSQSSVPF